MYDVVYRLVNYEAGMLASSPPPDCPAGPVGIPSPVTQTSYSLDKLGNWASKDTDGVIQTRTHGPSNEITSINGTSVVSDFDGNTTNYGFNSYQYDEENRLIMAAAGPHNFTVGQYQYDAFGRRVSKIDNTGNQTLYYYDGWRTIEEQSPAGVTQATYVFGNYLDEVLTMDRGGHTYYYHQNALDSVFALTDPSGAGVEGYYYDAYGYQTVVLPGPDGILDFDSDDDYSPGARSSVGNPFTFTGQRFDPETGLLYYKNRHDSTFFGRFLQRDPLDYAAGDMNLYQYVLDEPTNLVDPQGTIYDTYFEYKEYARQKGPAGAGGAPANPAPKPAPKPMPKLDITVTRAATATSDCGAASFKVRWSVTDKGTGWVIQHLFTDKINVMDCDGKKVDKPKNDTETEFWEAWEVTNGDVWVGAAKDMVKHNADTFSSNNEGEGTCGTIEFAGKVKFVEGYKLTEPPWGHTVADARDLPTLRTKPEGWTDDGAADHTLKINWRCCPDKRQTTQAAGTP
jgi:RHS repeat-associated protein